TAIPGMLTNQTAVSNSMFMVDQSPTNSLATCEKHIYKLTVNSLGSAYPLRATLACTDPPGNPAVRVKLVNALDLIVTNMDDGSIYFGNDILAGNDFNLPWRTNDVPFADRVNNVENVYIPTPLGSNYTITVSAHRVNVNAVRQHTNDIVQD